MDASSNTRIDIQTQDKSGNWRTHASTLNDPQLIRARMGELKNQFPDQRVRAIDENGRLIDLMG